MKNCYYLFVLLLLFSSCQDNLHPGAVKSESLAQEILPEPVDGLPDANTEEYDRIFENEFLDVLKNPQSTFSIDVDAAAYANTRRFLNENRLPPKDAVRLEEFINYFNYDYAEPVDEHPFAIHTEVATCPWNTETQLLHIGLQGKKMPKTDLPDNNLVFLVDVSGSMTDFNKLPLLKSSFRLLLENLDENDQIAIVTYAGAAGLALPSTSCDQKETILQALENLEAGGSTAGGEGIRLAYKIAKENFKEEGNNRIILATDGDFNVGPSSDGALQRLIENRRETGVFLSIIGFGTGNYKDSKMETLTNFGNGNYYYIDNILEAKKVLVSEMGGTLFTIAKDVKIQIEFNPAKVKSYRLIGYENRLLANEDFNDDKKDAGELGAGHSVTALYEIVPNGGNSISKEGAQYKYVSTGINPAAYDSKEMAALRFRYKPPSDSVSQLIEKAVLDQTQTLDQASADYRFSAAVAAFGLLLRDSKYKGTASYDQVLDLAKAAKGEDPEGYRAEFLRLVETAKHLSVQ